MSCIAPLAMDIHTPARPAATRTERPIERGAASTASCASVLRRDLSGSHRRNESACAAVFADDADSDGQAANGDKVLFRLSVLFAIVGQDASTMTTLQIAGCRRAGNARRPHRMDTDSGISSMNDCAR
ncbi:hypothetical protein [Lysobacter antibioticus]|uniref:hypothetical protein n=1 Tax=Lysobacter antibioticus TaxID=84531 RepID=UPI00113FF7DE|nr:hypothetical protein [Lysobacter antibioticus]